MTELKQGNSSVSGFSTSLCSFIIPVDNYGREKCGCLAWECLCIAPKLHIPVHKEWSKVWTWTSLLVSQATTHILIENDQITAFPPTNKWQRIATRIEDGWAEKLGATPDVGLNTPREQACGLWAHSCAPQTRIAFPSSLVLSGMLFPTLGRRSPLFPRFRFLLVPRHLTLPPARGLQDSATMVGRLFLSLPLMLGNVI